MLTDGETVFLRVKNRSRQVLNVTVLALQADWAIVQVHPTNQDYDTLEPGSELRVQLRVGLPEGYDDARDVLKVFATLGSASYGWLQLPALDEPRGVRGSTPTNPLEALMGALTGEQAPTRNVTPVVAPSHSWSMAQVEVRARRADQD